MDLRGCKTAAPTMARWPRGGMVRLSPLPRHRVALAEAEAAAEHRARGCEPEGTHYEITRCACLLAAATGERAEVLLEALCAHELASLFAEWQAHQDAVADVASVEAMRGAVRRRMNDDGDVVRDGQASFLAPSPAEFYGRAATELTDAQIDYYTLARAAFQEFWVDGESKKVSREWLSRED